MTSPPPSPTFTASRNVPGKPHPKNDDPALSPKRSFAQHDEDQPSPLEPKRRHVHPEAQPCRRAPLDPLSASDLENRRGRGSQWTVSLSHHSLVTSSSGPDLRDLHPEQPVSSASCGKERSGISGAPVCSWPPPISTSGTRRSSCSSLAAPQASQRGSLPGADVTEAACASILESTSTRPPPDSLQLEATTAMSKPARTTGWKSDTVLQPIRARASSMPCVRRPPGDLWRSEPTRAAYGPVDAADSMVYSTPLTPPGLFPYRPELARNGCDSDPVSHGSVSLSLALGSRPVGPLEQTKSVPPIGAERSRVVPMTPLSSQKSTEPDDPSALLSSTQQHALNATSLEREHLERLLLHLVRNKYPPKIISPLSPLRTLPPTFALSAVPAYKLRLPSLSNIPSPRYSKCPPRRARTLCDSYLSLDLDNTCMHCQECRRDTVAKRLLAFRHRQQQSRHPQRSHLRSFPSCASSGTTSVVRAAREVFGYEVDEEEKTLWEEVAAVTDAGPLPFPRAGAHCAAAAVASRRALPATPRFKDLHDVDDGREDGGREDYGDVPDDGLVANGSATLFRDVSVY